MCVFVCFFVCLFCLALLGLACLACRFLPLLALLVIIGVAQRCLFFAWCYLALLVALVRFSSLTRFPFSCLPGGWVGGVALIRFPGGFGPLEIVEPGEVFLQCF